MGNEKISGKAQNCAYIELSTQSPLQNQQFGISVRELNKISNKTFPESST